MRRGKLRKRMAVLLALACTFTFSHETVSAEELLGGTEYQEEYADAYPEESDVETALPESVEINMEEESVGYENRVNAEELPEPWTDTESFESLAELWGTDFREIADPQGEQQADLNSENEFGLVVLPDPEGEFGEGEAQTEEYLSNVVSKNTAVSNAFNILQMADPAFHLNINNYNMTAAEITELTDKAKSITSSAYTYYDKIYAIAKWVAENIYYDYYYYRGYTNSLDIKPMDVYRSKKTVCDGYARLSQNLLQYIGIPCMYVLADDHAYNAAWDNENNRWLVFDTTWMSQNKYDLVNGSWTMSKGKSVTWSRFNMSASTLASLNNHEIFYVNNIVYNKSGWDDMTYYFSVKTRTASDFLDLDNWSMQIQNVRNKGAIRSLGSVSGVLVTGMMKPVFDGAQYVTSLDLRSSKLESISAGAFSDFTAMNTLYLPNTIKTLGYNVFRNCTALETVDLSKTQITFIEEQLFWGSGIKNLTLPAGKITKIGASAFKDCKNLTDLSFMDGQPITTIGPGAFEGCTAITSVTLPSTVTTVSNYAFSDCTSLMYVDFGKTKLTKLGYYCIPMNDGGDGTLIFPSTISAVSNSWFDRNYTSKDRYNFVFRDGAGKVYAYVDDVLKTGTRTVYYRFQVCSAKVIYEMNGGKNYQYNSEYVLIGMSMPLSSASKSGYYFVGWYLEPDFRTEIKEIRPTSADDIRIYAKFEKSGGATPGGGDTKPSGGDTNPGGGDTNPGGGGSNTTGGIRANGTQRPNRNAWIDLKLNSAGEFLYYENFVYQPEVYGFVDYAGGAFLVANGKVATEINGLAPDLDLNAFYYLSNGQVQTQYTGLVQYDGAWFYVGHGKMDVNKSGFVDYDGSKFYVGLGRIMTEVSGLAQDPATGKWYYLSGGQVQTQYSGLVQYDGAWFYVSNGWMNPKAYGWTQYNGSWFYVLNGMVVG